MASSSNSPCAACKFLRRKCTQECTFAPYFPPDQPIKFANVHKVFGASNVAKLLNELSPSQREDAVNSLAYEANARLQDPVYGCVGVISLLQQQLKQVQNDLHIAKKELSSYIGPSAMLPLTHQHPHHHHHLLQQNPALIANAMGPFGMSAFGASHHHHQSQLLLREHQQHQQLLEAQQLAVVVAAREQQDMLRSYEQQQHQQQQQQQQQHQELVRFNSGFDGGSIGGVGSDGGPFNQISSGTPSPLALVPFDNPFQVPQPDHQDQHHQPQQQLQLQQQQQQQQQEERAAGSDEESKDNISTFHVVGTSS